MEIATGPCSPNYPINNLPNLEINRGCMGRLRCVQRFWLIITIAIFAFLPACGKSKPPGPNPFPAKISLNPPTSASLQFGATLLFTASAQNSVNTNINATFTYATSNAGVVDISPSGFACAGSWNAPSYNVCTPGAGGTAQITASALGATSPPTLVFVHPPIDNIQVSLVPPVNSPPPACPTQIALPAACAVKFNPAAANYCLSQNQVQTLQATAYSQGVDITPTVGPFTWNQANAGVVTITPIITSTTTNTATNQATVVSNTPGATQVVATASGVSSQPYIAETCPVQCITLELGENGSQNIGQTSFITNKGTNETITATAVDVQGCIVPKAPLTWTSSSPAAVTAGSATAGCAAGAACSVTTSQPGAGVVTASCTPPACNVGFPLNAPGLPALYLPQPVYSVGAISGLVTGATSATNVLATSQDCYSNAQCGVGLYNVSTTTNLAGSSTSMPAPPNSLLFDAAGDKAYAGSQFGAFVINVGSLGSSTNPFILLPASGTPLGQVTGRVIAVSANGNSAIFSDTVSTPNQVYVVNNSGTATGSVPLNINSATTATFSPDSAKAFILGDGGNTLYVYSPLQALQKYPLTAPANTVAFSSNGAFAFLAGGNSAGGIDVLNTCNNLPATITIAGLPASPTFLKMVPPGSAPTGNATIPALSQDDLHSLDVFVGVDSTGVDVIATTNASLPPPVTTLCPLQQITLANTNTLTPTPFPPTHIDLQKGTFHPLNFFLSPDGNQVFIITSDQGVLVYSFATQSVNAIPLSGNAAPVAGDMSVDGTLLYVAGTDGILHELDTLLLSDQMEISFAALPNSSNNFCDSSYPCTLNIVAVKP
jgi:hypothetical protein